MRNITILFFILLTTVWCPAPAASVERSLGADSRAGGRSSIFVTRSRASPFSVASTAPCKAWQNSSAISAATSSGMCRTSGMYVEHTSWSDGRGAVFLEVASSLAVPA